MTYTVYDLAYSVWPDGLSTTLSFRYTVCIHIVDMCTTCTSICCLHPYSDITYMVFAGIYRATRPAQTGALHSVLVDYNGWSIFGLFRLPAEALFVTTVHTGFLLV